MVSLLYSNNRRKVSHQEEVGLLFVTHAFVQNHFFLLYYFAATSYMSHNCNSLIIFCSSVFLDLSLSLSLSLSLFLHFLLSHTSSLKIRPSPAWAYYGQDTTLFGTLSHIFTQSYTHRYKQALSISILHTLTSLSLSSYHTRTYTSHALIVLVSERAIDLRTGKKVVYVVGVTNVANVPSEKVPGARLTSWPIKIILIDEKLSVCERGER